LNQTPIEFIIFLTRPEDNIMAEMKSAFERAWERAEGLGKLTPQEIRERKEEEFTLIGRGLAQQYLGHGHLDVFQQGVDKYGAEEKEIATKGVLSSLVAAMEIENYDLAMRAMAGILNLKGNGQIREIAEKVRAIFQEYEQAKQERYEKEKGQLQREEREILHQLRISGSAIDEINLEVSGAWDRACAELRSQFGAGVHQLKEELSSLLGIGQT
jgi:hypothetical protein